MPTPPLSSAQLLKSLVDCGKQFYDRHWMEGTAGNLSVKLKQSPLEIAITPSGVSKGSLKTEDLMLLKQTPQGLRPAAKKGETPRMPSAETAIHQAIHESLPGCGAVFHVHPVHATLMSGLFGNPKQRQMLQLEWIEMMKGIGIGEGEIAQIPIFPNWQDIPRVAQDVRQYLAQTPNAPPAILIYNHGLTAWGHTPDQARNHLEIVDYICQYFCWKRMVSRA